MGIILDNLRYSLANDFARGFSSNNYYLFASSLTDADVSGNNDASAKLFLEKTIFGKKLQPNNVLFMVRKILWLSGTVYDQYDDAVDLSTLNFYVISEPDAESGDFAVFKCISNGNGSPSTDKPVYTEALASQNYTLRTSDGYVWRYMYKVTSSQAQTFSTTTLFPVIPDSAVVNNTKQGIDNIVITNPLTNFGYNSQTGSVLSIRSAATQEGFRVISLSGQGFNPIRGFYKGYSFYVSSADGVTSKLYSVQDSGIGVSDQRPYVAVTGYVDGDLPNVSSVTWNYTISPAVEIIGDGTGATAISTVVNNRIVGISVLNSGENYTRVAARIIPPSIGFNPSSGDVVCVLRAILAPTAIYDAVGGHGGNPASELRARHIVIFTLLDVEDDQVLPATNTYSKIGVVRDPVFSTEAPLLFDNRLRVSVGSTDRITPGDIVSQPSTNFRGIVHSVDSINSVIYVTEFYGPYVQTETSFFLSNLVPLDDNEPLITPVGRVEIATGGITYPSYEKGTGELLYVSEFEPIERSDNLAEQFKFIISF